MGIEVTDELNKKFDGRYVVVAESGCWVWTGALTNHPTHRYGNLPVRKSFNYRAHRYSAARFLGAKLTPQDFVCHKCDVPECVNPDHLYVGSPMDNVSDRDDRMRHKTPSGEGHPNAKITEQQALEIFMLDGNHRKIAEIYGISRPTVTAIKAGRLWADATKNLRQRADA